MDESTNRWALNFKCHSVYLFVDGHEYAQVGVKNQMSYRVHLFVDGREYAQVGIKLQMSPCLSVCRWTRVRTGGH